MEPDLFDRAQAVFAEKVKGRKARKHLDLLLTDKIVCPRCRTFLTGEHHRKPSGKVFRYYRCHTPGCVFVVRAQEVEEKVFSAISEKLGSFSCDFKALDIVSILQDGDLVAKRRLLQSLVTRVMITEGGKLSVIVIFAI